LNVPSSDLTLSDRNETSVHLSVGRYPRIGDLPLRQRDLGQRTPEKLVLADVRWYLDGRSAHDAYRIGHLPGAVFVDLDAWLAGDPSSGAGRHPLPRPETFARGMSTLGISDESTVVAYDDQGGVIAARLVWMLRVTGRDAAVLDGGLAGTDHLSSQEILFQSSGASLLAPGPQKNWPASRMPSTCRTS